MTKQQFQILMEELKVLKSQYTDVDKRLDNVEKVMLAQEINLKEHMRRSDHLEDIIDHLKENDIKVLNEHKSKTDGVLKFLGVLSVLISIVTGIAKLYHII